MCKKTLFFSRQPNGMKGALDDATEWYSREVLRPLQSCLFSLCALCCVWGIHLAWPRHVSLRGAFLLLLQALVVLASPSSDPSLT